MHASERFRQAICSIIIDETGGVRDIRFKDAQVQDDDLLDAFGNVIAHNHSPE